MVFDIACGTAKVCNVVIDARDGAVNVLDALGVLKYSRR